MHSEILQKLADKLADKSFTLGVIGLGSVGLLLYIISALKDLNFES
jgi:UDP-N-acetyl-D-mannosaminuronate dehydrogenase